ncbi:MAG: hypothetical protein AAB768_01105 [Patescibacteria group bacterium]
MKMIIKYWQVAICALVTNVGVLLMFWRYLPPEVPLWYGRPWGQDMLTGKAGLWWIPVIIICFHAIGITLYRLLKSDSLLAGLVLATISVSQIVCTLALLRIVMIII